MKKKSEPKLPILSTRNFHCQDRLGKGGGDGNKRPPIDRKQTQGKKPRINLSITSDFLLPFESLFVSNIKNSNRSMIYAFTLMDTCRDLSDM